MLLFRILIVWVLLQGTPLVRDIFDLPLHDGRSLLVDALILIFCFSLFILNLASTYQGAQSRGSAEYNNKNIIEYEILNRLNSSIAEKINDLITYLKYFFYLLFFFFKNIKFHYLVLIWAIPGFFIYEASRINGSTALMYFKQYMLFIALIQFIFWAVKYGKTNSFFSVILNGSFLFLSVQVLLFALNTIFDGLYQDLIQKNSFPIAMLILGEICRQGGMRNEFKRFIVIGAISATIAAAKLFFLLAVLLFILNRSINFFKKSPHARGFVSVASHYLIVFSPFIIPHAIMHFFNINIDDFIEIEDDRYFIDDNIGSLVSRVYSFTYLLAQENFLTVFGSNESAMSQVVFWGYPVHNIYASVAYSHGALVLTTLILYHLAIYRFLRRNAELGVILGFIIIYFNDIYPMLSLFFIPYFLRNNIGAAPISAGQCCRK